jgi:hypothetical protein
LVGQESFERFSPSLVMKEAGDLGCGHEPVDLGLGVNVAPSVFPRRWERSVSDPALDASDVSIEGLRHDSERHELLVKVVVDDGHALEAMTGQPGHRD